MTATFTAASALLAAARVPGQVPHLPAVVAPQGMVSAHYTDVHGHGGLALGTMLAEGPIAHEGTEEKSVVWMPLGAVRMSPPLA